MKLLVCSCGYQRCIRDVDIASTMFFHVFLTYFAGDEDMFINISDQTKRLRKSRNISPHMEDLNILKNWIGQTKIGKTPNVDMINKTILTLIELC